MTRRDGAADPDVDDLVEAITAKLRANAPVLKQSISHGRLSWRVAKGRIEINLEPRL